MSCCCRTLSASLSLSLSLLQLSSLASSSNLHLFPPQLPRLALIVHELRDVFSNQLLLRLNPGTKPGYGSTHQVMGPNQVMGPLTRLWDQTRSWVHSPGYGTEPGYGSTHQVMGPNQVMGPLTPHYCFEKPPSLVVCIIIISLSFCSSLFFFFFFFPRPANIRPLKYHVYDGIDHVYDGIDHIYDGIDHIYDGIDKVLPRVSSSLSMQASMNDRDRTSVRTSVGGPPPSPGTRPGSTPRPARCSRFYPWRASWRVPSTPRGASRPSRRDPGRSSTHPFVHSRIVNSTCDEAAFKLRYNDWIE